MARPPSILITYLYFKFTLFNKTTSLIFLIELFKIFNLKVEASRGTGAHVCDCKRDGLWVRFLLEK